MRTLITAVAIVSLVACRSAAQGADNMPPPGFTALFNGKDLTGWKGLLKGPYDNPAQRAKLSPERTGRSSRRRPTRTCGPTGRSRTAPWSSTARGGASAPPRTTAISRCTSTGRSCPTATAASTSAAARRCRSGTNDRPEGSGGLYNNQKNPSKPSKCADKPIGQWNTFRIKMVGEKVSVWLNGELVVDNVVMENYWERDKPIYPTGQIELQNHGNTLYFKNVYLREISGSP